jgi:hypothetical protein
VLPYLPCQGAQFFELVGAAQQLLVVSASALGALRSWSATSRLILRSCLTAVQMLMWMAASMARSVIIDIASRYVVSNITGIMLLLKLCCVEGDHKLSY